MKLLAALASAAVASASYLPALPVHVPQLVAHPNGAVTPADEPAVVAARADHLAAKGIALNAAIASGPGYIAGPAIAPVAPAVAPVGLGYAGPIAAPIGRGPYVGPLAGVPALVAHPNGAVTPADEPAVVAARADHLAAKGVALNAAIASGPGYIAGPAIAPIAPAVAPFGLGYAGPIAAGPIGYAGPLAGVPALVAHPNGAVTPADEPAVVAARADHLAAKGVALNAAILSGPGYVAGPAIAPVAAPVFAPAVPALGYAGPIAAGPIGYAGPLAGVPALVAHPNGAVVPADEPAVVAARADHLAAKGTLGW